MIFLLSNFIVVVGAIDIGLEELSRASDASPSSIRNGVKLGLCSVNAHLPGMSRSWASFGGRLHDVVRQAGQVLGFVFDDQAEGVGFLQMVLPELDVELAEFFIDGLSAWLCPPSLRAAPLLTKSR